MAATRIQPHGDFPEKEVFAFGCSKPRVDEPDLGDTVAVVGFIEIEQGILNRPPVYIYEADQR